MSRCSGPSFGISAIWVLIGQVITTGSLASVDFRILSVNPAVPGMLGRREEREAETFGTGTSQGELEQSAASITRAKAPSPSPLGIWNPDIFFWRELAYNGVIGSVCQPMQILHVPSSSVSASRIQTANNVCIRLTECAIWEWGGTLHFSIMSQVQSNVHCSFSLSKEAPFKWFITCFHIYEAWSCFMQSKNSSYTLTTSACHFTAEYISQLLSQKCCVTSCPQLSVAQNNLLFS